MAGFKLLLSQSRRLSLPHFSSSCFLPLHRSLSSSSSSDSQSLPIQPVSYAPKPKDPPQPDQTLQSAPPEEGTRSTLSREDLRYVKDVPNISPISYPTRVAPLPEDRVGEARGQESEEMARESRKIQAESRAWRTPFRVAAEEEKVVIPFPMLIMPEKKNEKRPVLDLMDAIREVKVCVKCFFFFETILINTLFIL